MLHPSIGRLMFIAILLVNDWTSLLGSDAFQVIPPKRRWLQVDRVSISPRPRSCCFIAKTSHEFCSDDVGDGREEKRVALPFNFTPQTGAYLSEIDETNISTASTTKMENRRPPGRRHTRVETRRRTVQNYCRRDNRETRRQRRQLAQRTVLSSFFQSSNFLANMFPGPFWSAPDLPKRASSRRRLHSREDLSSYPPEGKTPKQRNEPIGTMEIRGRLQGSSTVELPKRNPPISMEKETLDDVRRWQETSDEGSVAVTSGKMTDWRSQRDLTSPSYSRDSEQFPNRLSSLPKSRLPEFTIYPETEVDIDSSTGTRAQRGYKSDLKVPFMPSSVTGQTSLDFVQDKDSSQVEPEVDMHQQYHGISEDTLRLGKEQQRPMFPPRKRVQRRNRAIPMTEVLSNQMPNRFPVEIAVRETRNATMPHPLWNEKRYSPDTMMVGSGPPIGNTDALDRFSDFIGNAVDDWLWGSTDGLTSNVLARIQEDSFPRRARSDSSASSDAWNVGSKDAHGQVHDGTSIRTAMGKVFQMRSFEGSHLPGLWSDNPPLPKGKPFWDIQGNVISRLFGNNRRPRDYKDIQPSRRDSESLLRLLQFMWRHISNACEGIGRWASVRGVIPQPVVAVIVGLVGLYSGPRARVPSIALTILAVRAIGELLHDYLGDDSDFHPLTLEKEEYFPPQNGRRGVYAKIQPS